MDINPLKMLFLGMIKYGYIFVISAVVSLTAFLAAGSVKVPEREQIVSMRRIGHKLLLKSGDSISRVLPIKQLSENEFEIHFEKPIALNPDALADITGTEQKAGSLPNGYIVTVHDCAQGNIQYAFSMPLKGGELTPCLGRKLPPDCYYITICIEQSNNAAWLSAGVLPLFLFFGWNVYRKKSNVELDKIESEGEIIKIGNAEYHPAVQRLKVNGEDIALTAKEAHVLSIFAGKINQEVTRERLQREVWEDDGVIVGRSLDMFISKLRKKLQGDPTIQIVSIHGKGYKLITDIQP